jgi:hypothetical protein
MKFYQEIKNDNRNNKNINKNISHNFNLLNVLKLPEDMINVIKEYIPTKCLVFTNKTNYYLYHSTIKENIIGNQFESYVRDMIRRDNDLAFAEIIKENIELWFKVRSYEYKHFTYNNYLYFLLDYCIENDSNKCRILIKEYINQS